MRKNTTLIAGPTASGKSALALRIARENDGIVVNADSMQVYGVLQVLTARPEFSAMEGVPHYLFGHVDPATLYSAGAWCSDVRSLLSKNELQERHIVFVGGTGLYFRALLGGLSKMPEIPQAVREHWRSRLLTEGSEALHRELGLRDPEAAKRLKIQDKQRIVRAIEVFEASGRPISYWQGETGEALVDASGARKICIVPEREPLAEKIRQRFLVMIKHGALEEVAALRALRLDPALPAMKAIGVAEISHYLDGTISLETAIELACAASRQYAKRQMTWLRHQFAEGWERRSSQGEGFGGR